jgi:hypothetical protein
MADMNAKGFSFQRFTGLLSAALEVATIAALIVRTVLFIVWWRSGGDSLDRTKLDHASMFLLLVIFALLLTDVFRLFAEGKRAVIPTIRAIVYLLLFCLSPYPLGTQQRHAGSNQTMQNSRKHSEQLI